MPNSMSMRNMMMYGNMEAITKKKKKKKIVVDGKEYDESDFDDTRRWSKVKNKRR